MIVLFLFIRLIHSVTKNLAEHGDKLDDKTKEEVQKAIDDAKTLPSDASVDVVKAKVTELSSASMKIGQAMYSKKGSDSDSGDAGAAANSSNNSTDGTHTDSSDAKDAEYETKSEKKTK